MRKKTSFQNGKGKRFSNSFDKIVLVNLFGQNKNNA